MERLIGLVLVIFSAVTFGANPICARMVYSSGGDPQTFLFFRFTIASVFFVGMMFCQRRHFPRGRLLFQLIVLGSVGMGGSGMLYYSALNMAPVNLVIVLIYLYPAIVTLLSAVFLKQPVTHLKKTALLLSFLGIACTVGLDQGGQLLGIIMALTAATIFSVFLVLSGPVIRAVGVLPAATIISVVSALTYGLMTTYQGIKLPVSATAWGIIVANAVFSGFIGNLAFFAGIKRIGASDTAIVSTLEIVVAVGLAMVLLNEYMTGAQVIGAMMVIGAIVMISLNDRKVSKRAWNPPSRIG